MSIRADTALMPADELLLLRRQIASLRAREAELRGGLLDGTLGPRGRYANVRIRRGTNRCFLRDLLPADVLADRRYWREVPRATVMVDEVEGALSPVSVGSVQRSAIELDDDDFEVIEVL